MQHESNFWASITSQFSGHWQIARVGDNPVELPSKLTQFVYIFDASNSFTASAMCTATNVRKAQQFAQAEQARHPGHVLDMASHAITFASDSGGGPEGLVAREKALAAALCAITVTKTWEAGLSAMSLRAGYPHWGFILYRCSGLKRTLRPLFTMGPVRNLMPIEDYFRWMATAASLDLAEGSQSQVSKDLRADGGAEVDPAFMQMVQAVGEQRA